MRSVVVQDPLHTDALEQKIEQLVTEAFTRVAKKFTGVTLPLARKGSVATDNVTPDKGSSPRYS